MTTKVTVDAHAGWPVKVTIIDRYDGEEHRTESIVPALSKQEFHATNTRSFLIEEMPQEAATPPV